MRSILYLISVYLTFQNRNDYVIYRFDWFIIYLYIHQSMEALINYMIESPE